jgi:putative transcriptional regulator
VDGHPAAALPATFERMAKGRWRRVALGIRRAPLRGVSGLGESVHLLDAASDAPLRLPAATRLLLVLRGAVRTAASAYLPGDFIETAGARLKEARAHAASGCLCLVVGDDDLYERLPADGRMRLRA